MTNTTGSRVFIPDPHHAWVPALVQSIRDGRYVSIEIEDVHLNGAFVPQKDLTLGEIVGQEREVDLGDKDIQQQVSKRSTQNVNNDRISLPLRNTYIDKNGVSDMITLDNLHEGAILYNLRHRFFRKIPYTYTGKICIAVNPYQWLDLYGSDTMESYARGDRRSDALPHIYATSREAYTKMRLNNSNHSILVSGESGAGKTETSKIIMCHLAKMASGDSEVEAQEKVIERIIQANPLLESFGNAKTARNDNSSRFGKFTELQFGKKGALIGARSRTYLLEKSRVTKQGQGERSFHIFYQMLAVATTQPALKLSSKTKYSYIIEDEKVKEDAMTKEFNSTMKALDLIGIEEVEQESILRILAAILHLGQVAFISPDGDIDKSDVKDAEVLSTAANLLGISAPHLKEALCNRNVIVSREVYLKPITSDQAKHAMDALAKALYSRLFEWLVGRINQAISVSESSVTSFIGLLDIFGFENFMVNSFEQLCINYANEKLQQKFVQDILKTLQEEYEEEGICWDHIDFADNQDVLDVIEGRLGVLSILNEECLLSAATDDRFARKLTSILQDNPLIEKPRLNNSAFTISHYAGKVTYDTAGFLEKHRDTLLQDLVLLMSKSTIDIVNEMFPLEPSIKGPARRGAASNKSTRAVTVGMQFKNSLATLMEKINETEVHYVRCLKPNSKKSERLFDHTSVVNQLRYAGVIEAIRVSRTAYPHRISHRDCIGTFAVLWKGGPLEPEKVSSELLLEHLLPGRLIDDYQVGNTRVYFREGVLEELQGRRGLVLRDRAILIQKTARCYIHSRYFKLQKKSIIIIQKTLQAVRCRRRFLACKKGVIALQARKRGQCGRVLVRKLKLFKKVALIQACFRKFKTRRAYRKTLAAIVLIQSFFRMAITRSHFLGMLSNDKKNKALNSKIARLQTRLETGRGNANESGSAKLRGEGVKPRPSEGTTSGLFNESAEVLTTLKEENERLRNELEKLTEVNGSLKEENRKLREWQKAKEVDERVKTLAQRDQESKDLAYLTAIEREYQKLRVFLVEKYSLSIEDAAGLDDDTTNTATLKESGPNNNQNELLTETLNSSSMESTRALVAGVDPVDFDAMRESAQTLISRSGTRLARAKMKSGKGSSRRVKDYWEEIKNFPPAMQYGLGSVPWRRLLSDWAQGNPKKLDYMTRWLKNVIDGGNVESGPFPMGVELKSVSPMMLDGFMQLVIPKLDERPDVNVHVHTKEFIGTSMRITLSIKEGVAHKPKLPSKVDSSSSSVSNAQGDLEEWGRSSIRSVRQ